VQINANPANLTSAGFLIHNIVDKFYVPDCLYFNPLQYIF